MWAPYQGPLDAYPRVALQQITGPLIRQRVRKMAQPISTTITIDAAAPGLIVIARIACQVFEVVHTGDTSTTAQALRDLITLRRPAWTVGGAGADVTVSDPLRLIFDARGINYCAEVNADDGDIVYVFVYTREITVQASVFATTSKMWATDGSSQLAIQITDAVDEWDPAPHRVFMRPGNVGSILAFPSGQSGALTQNVVEITAWYTEAANPLVDLVERVSGTVNDEAFITDPP